MPWKETCVKDQRQKFVLECLSKEENMTTLCEAYDISRRTGYKWLERFHQSGWTGLLDQSRAPSVHPNATAEKIMDEVIALRQKHSSWGPKKIRARLQKIDPTTVWPAASTIGQRLTRDGLVRSRKRKRRTPPFDGPLRVGLQPNEVWSADFKGWFRTQDATRIDPLTLTDNASRYLLHCQALRSTNGLSVRAQFERVFREYGLPQRIRTDNGTPFASTALGGLSCLSVWWIRLGIVPERIALGQPQENGRHERMHRTLKQDTAMPPKASFAAQQTAFDDYRRLYNDERPHEALGMQCPSDFYRPSEQSFPARLPELVYPGHYVLRRVRHNGEIKWRGHYIYVSVVLHGQTIGLDPIDEDHFTIYFGPMRLAFFDARTGTIQSLKTTSKVLPMCPV